MENHYHSSLRQHDLFSSLSEDEFQQAIKFLKKTEFKAGDFIFQEGDDATEFFIIMAGEVEILKYGVRSKEIIKITTLSVGDLLGEMTLLDSGQRSASAKALTPVSVVRISFNDLKEVAERDLHFSKVLLKISKRLSMRLRESNETTLQALEKQLDEQRLRVSLGSFMMNVVVALCLFSFSLRWLEGLGESYIGDGVINPANIIISLIFLVFVFLIMKFSKLPPAAFGLTFKGWRGAVLESLAITTVFCALMTFTKWLLIKTTTLYAHAELFSLDHKVPTNNVHFSHLTLWLGSLLIYCLIISPLQELLTRGGLQGPLEIFLKGKWTRWKAILISNIMFSTAHLFISIEFSVMVFFAGIYFGWLYSRHHNLFGVAVAHALLGGWGFWILGIYP